MPGPNGSQLSRHPLFLGEFTLAVARVPVTARRSSVAGPQLLVAAAPVPARALTVPPVTTGCAARAIALVPAALSPACAIARTLAVTIARCTAVPARLLSVTGARGSPVSTGLAAARTLAVTSARTPAVPARLAVTTTGAATTSSGGATVPAAGLAVTRAGATPIPV
ncbi:hypothetical protein [Leifsonia poae]|uniref:hypothetical protein n=1 Tax=Leifsonia poae TaxID=110933 RepID=UPI001CBDA702|nr:hypothetical protein [Leifsonia poae]